MEPYPDRSTFLRLLKAARERFEELPRSREKSIVERYFDDMELWSLRVPEWEKT